LCRSGAHDAVLQPIKGFAHSLQCGFEEVPIFGKVRTYHLGRSCPIRCASPSSTLPRLEYEAATARTVVQQAHADRDLTCHCL
jgi:hypothetical protein